MTQDNTGARAVHRQSTEGRPDNEIEMTLLLLLTVYLPEPGDQRMCARRSELRQHGKIVLSICLNNVFRFQIYSE